MKKSYLMVTASIIALACLSGASLAQSLSETSTPVRALLAPKVETVLSGQIAGKIIRINRKLGERFKAGQRLISFDCAVHNAELKKARASLRSAKATLAANEQMFTHRAVGELEVETAKADVDQAKAEVGLRLAYVNMCHIKAPFNGRVIQRLAKPHQYVAAGEPLLEVLDDSVLQLELYVPSSWAQWLKPKLEFKVRVDETATEYPAVITRIGAKVVSVSQNLLVHAELKQKHKELLSGMSGNAYFTLPVTE